MSQPDPDAQQPPGGHAPTTQIHQAHLYALRARQNYVSVSMSNAGEDLLGHAHHQLNRAVLRYLEAMKYLLRTKQTITKYWHGKPPEDEQADFDAGTAWLYTSVHDDTLTERDLQAYQAAFYEEKGVDPALAQTAHKDDDIPKFTVEHVREFYRQERGLRPVDRVKFAMADAHDGYDVRVQRPHYGLKRLAGQWEQRRTVKKTKTGMLGTRTVEHERPELLPPRVLIRAGTALDEAADALSLLASVDESENLPMIRDFDTSGEEQTGELGYGQYNKSPEL